MSQTSTCTKIHYKQLLSWHQNQHWQYKNMIFNTNQQYISAADMQSKQGRLQFTDRYYGQRNDKDVSGQCVKNRFQKYVKHIKRHSTSVYCLLHNNKPITYCKIFHSKCGETATMGRQTHQSTSNSGKHTCTSNITSLLTTKKKNVMQYHYPCFSITQQILTSAQDSPI